MLSWISKQQRGFTTLEIVDLHKMLGLSKAMTIDEGKAQIGLKLRQTLLHETMQGMRNPTKDGKAKLEKQGFHCLRVRGRTVLRLAR